MRIMLSEETQDRIHEALGPDVDLTPDAVPAVLARLAVEAPETYSQVLEELSGSQIRLDSEEELRRRRRRGILRRLVFGWGEYESTAGDRLLEKRRVAAAVPLACAALTLGLLVYAALRGHPAAPPAPRVPAAMVHRTPDGLASRLPALIAPRRAAAPAAAPMKPPPPAPVRAAAAPLPPLPGLEPLPPPVAPHAPSPIVVSRPAVDRPDPLKVDAEKQASPVVYNRSGEASAGSGDAEKAQGGPETGRTGARAAADTAAPDKRFAPGTRLDATLVTGAMVVAGGSPVPVIAESADPHALWTGQATLAPGDRIQLVLSLSNGGRGGAVRAIALDPDRRLPGLAGHTTVRHSSAAAAMAAAALQAASDYAQAEAHQGTFGVLGGFSGIFLGGQTPEAWTFLAARLAQEFQTRSTSGGWVTTTEVPAGTRLTILVTGAS
jgi:hypothetical protein